MPLFGAEKEYMDLGHPGQALCEASDPDSYNSMPLLNLNF